MDLFESGGGGGGAVNSGFTVFTFLSGSTGLMSCSIVQDHRYRVLTVTAAPLGCCRCTEGVRRAVYSGSGREARKIF